MFTGIIQAVGTISAMERNSFGMRLGIDPQGWDYAPGDGDSVCVSGVCLTYVAEASEPGRRLVFDVIRETLETSTLGRLHTGSKVNLEPALTASTPMGGHFVQGHVDGVGKVTGVASGADEWRIEIRPPRELAVMMVPKGSVCIEGVSLTIAATHGRASEGDFGFEVAIIPTTLRMTTLAALRAGDEVNLETDMIARTVVHWLEQQAGAKGDGVTREKLRDAGFM